MADSVGHTESRAVVAEDKGVVEVATHLRAWLVERGAAEALGERELVGKKAGLNLLGKGQILAHDVLALGEGDGWASAQLLVGIRA